MNNRPEIDVLGIDTGGTFTDYVGVTASGKTVNGKVSSTPEDPSKSLGRILDRLTLSETCRFVHGTTVATNALLEDELAEVLFVTNHGLEGLLKIGRGTRSGLYDLDPDPEEYTLYGLPVATVDLRDHPFHEDSVDGDRPSFQALRETVNDRNPDVVAVCLVHSYRNPEPERLVKEALEDLPVRVVLSCDVLPRFREFERASTTVVNAGLIPVISRYLRNLRELAELPEDRYLMSSDRGALNFDEAVDRPVLTVLSGPAGGVVGSRKYLADEGIDRYISMDMGGTSTDVAAVDGTVPLTDDHRVGGYKLSIPMVDLHTVGSGGSSIIWVDDANQLRVGPESAGADPGPACYGKGGPATLTDAQLVLGRIPEERPLSEDLVLEPAHSRRRLKKRGEQLSMSSTEVAAGALKLARTKLVEAVRSITVREGVDPASFVLFAYGGAGGLFAAKLAQELKIETVYVPRRAGVAAAAGLIWAPKFAQRSMSPLRPLEGESTPPELKSLEDRAPDWTSNQTDIRFEAECRFRGQTHNLTIDFKSGTKKESALRRQFREKYSQKYGYLPNEEKVELVHLNAYWREEFDRVPSMKTGPRPGKQLDRQTLRTEGTDHEVEVLSLETFNKTAKGPCLISGSTTTIFVPSGWTIYPTSDQLVRLTK